MIDSKKEAFKNALLGILALIFSSIVQDVVSADFSFTNFDLPDQTYQPMDINNLGQVVGYHVQDNRPITFLLENGTYTDIPYTDIPYPDSDTQSMMGVSINDAGEIAGRFYSLHVGNQAFRYHNGAFTLIAPCGVDGTWTYVYGINDSGDVVGTCPGVDGAEKTFIESYGEYTELPDPAVSEHFYHFATGINDSGQVVGSYQGNIPVSGYEPFIWSLTGGYEYPFPPMSEVGFDHPFQAGPVDINDSGQVLIYYRDGCRTFLYDSGKVTYIYHPLSQVEGDSRIYTTCTHGLNDQGKLVGTFYDGERWRGFIATLVGGGGGDTVTSNLVINPSFEEGTTGWVFDGTHNPSGCGGDGIGTGIHWGVFRSPTAAYLNCFGSDPSITQEIETIPGDYYLISFLANGNSYEYDYHVTAAFGSTIGYSFTDSVRLPTYYNFGSYTFVGQADEAREQFAFSGNLGGGTIFLE